MTSPRVVVRGRGLTQAQGGAPAADPEALRPTRLDPDGESARVQDLEVFVLDLGAGPWR